MEPALNPRLKSAPTMWILDAYRINVVADFAAFLDTDYPQFNRVNQHQ